jgi:hypothetical protein
MLAIESLPGKRNLRAGDTDIRVHGASRKFYDVSRGGVIIELPIERATLTIDLGEPHCVFHAALVDRQPRPVMRARFDSPMIEGRAMYDGFTVRIENGDGMVALAVLEHVPPKRHDATALVLGKRDATAFARVIRQLEVALPMSTLIF